MTDFENDTLQKLLYMKAAELKKEGKEEFAKEVDKLAGKLIAYECFVKSSDK